MDKNAFSGPGNGYIVTCWDELSGRWTFRPVLGGPLLSDAEVAALGLDAPLLAGPPESDVWAFPVGEGQYPPERWYAYTIHDLTGALNRNGYKHSGLDLNLDVAPWGDIERLLGLAVYAIADGVVTYTTAAWSGVPMIVIRHEHDGVPLWVRYAHITPVVMEEQAIKRGQILGGFANYTLGDGGDHLHFDMATNAFTREWLTPTIQWVDPVPILKAHLDSKRVAAMLRKGD